MTTWGDQTCQRFEATAVGFETGFSRLRVRHSNIYIYIYIYILHIDNSMQFYYSCITNARSNVTIFFCLHI